MPKLRGRERSISGGEGVKMIAFKPRRILVTTCLFGHVRDSNLGYLLVIQIRLKYHTQYAPPTSKTVCSLPLRVQEKQKTSVYSQKDV